MDFMERVLVRMKELNLKPKDLHKHGISKANYSQYLQGISTPSSEKAVALASALNTTIDFLLTGKGPKELAINSNDYPILNNAQLYDIEKYTSVIDAQRLVSSIDGSAQAFWYKSQGHAMSPKILINDMVFVDPKVLPTQNSIALFYDPSIESAFIREYLMDGGQIFYKALNKDWPNKIESLPENTSVVGTVIALTRHLT